MTREITVSFSRATFVIMLSPSLQFGSLDEQRMTGGEKIRGG